MYYSRYGDESQEGQIKAMKAISSQIEEAYREKTL